MKKFAQERLTWLGPAAILLVTLFIWGHSLLPAEQSSAESGRVVALLVPFFEKLKVAPEFWQTIVRKAAHMAEFALLGLAAYTVALIRCRAVSWPRKTATAGAVCMAVALVDETIQLPVPGRSGQISDVWIDLLGAVIGIALASAAAGMAALRHQKT